MTTGDIIETAVAVVLLAVAIVLYRRKSPDGYGNQGAVLLMAVGAFLLMHGLGLFDYRPSAAELGR